MIGPLYRHVAEARTVGSKCMTLNGCAVVSLNEIRMKTSKVLSVFKGYHNVSISGYSSGEQHTIV